MQKRVAEQDQVISHYKLAEDSGARALQRLQKSLETSDIAARQAVGELQRRCSVLQVTVCARHVQPKSSVHLM